MAEYALVNGPHEIDGIEIDTRRPVAKQVSMHIYI